MLRDWRTVSKRVLMHTSLDKSSKGKTFSSPSSAICFLLAEYWVPERPLCGNLQKSCYRYTVNAEKKWGNERIRKQMKVSKSNFSSEKVVGASAIFVQFLWLQ